MAVLTADTSLRFVTCETTETAGSMAVSALWRIRKIAPSSQQHILDLRAACAVLEPLESGV